MDDQVLGVADFIGLLNQTLEFAYPRVRVKGEISGYKVSQDKWVHFSLKDEEAVVDCFSTVWQLKTPLEDGMQVIVSARPKVRPQSGRFSLTVDKLTLAGEGALKRAYELLKRQLEHEGLFAPERKRPLPPYPRTLGLITSLDSAAYQDFMKILNQRWSGVTVKAAQVQVQGEAAQAQIKGALTYFNQLANPVDILVLVRGGGSLEDLAAFNSEEVVRAVAASRTPTIVGVGHESDVNLADLAADMRAATPTDAARLAVPNKREVMSGITVSQQQLERKLAQILASLRQQLAFSLRSLEQAASPGRLLRRVAELEERLLRQHRLSVNQAKQKLLALARTLKSQDPAHLLARGYAIARSGGQIIRSAEQVGLGDVVLLQLAKGKLGAKVERKYKE